MDNEGEHGRTGGEHDEQAGRGDIAQAGQAEQERQRPQNVELLLDGQRPQMAQQRGVTGVVRDVADDLAPVAGVEDGPRQVPPQVGQLGVGPGDERDDGDDGQHDDERG